VHNVWDESALKGVELNISPCCSYRACRNEWEFDIYDAHL